MEEHIGPQRRRHRQGEIAQQQIPSRHPELGHHINIAIPTSVIATTHSRTHPHRAGPAHTPNPARPNATRPMKPTFSPNNTLP